MASAFNGRTTEKDINFGSQSYLSNTDSWHTDGGTISYGSTITMNSNSRCSITKSFENMKANYLKFKIKLSADDTSLTTDNFHAVTGIYTVTTEDANGARKAVNFHFFPKFIFEDSYENDYDIMQLGNNVKLISIKVQLINKEQVPVKILETGIYVSRVIDPEYIQEQIEYDVMTNEEIKDYIDSLIGDYGCFIRLLNTQAELSTVQEGELCRCAWIQ